MTIITERPTTTMHTMSVYELGYDNCQVVDLNGTPFYPETYSRFKYGDGSAVSEYAREMAERLLDEYPEMIDEGYVAGSAYKHVPTAAHYISSRLIGELTELGAPPAGAFRIDRGVVRANDYSSLSEEERVACTTSNGLFLPEVSLSELQDRPALVIDDIKVTGSHEAALKGMLGNIGLRSVLFGYIALVKPEVAATYPQIEFDINHAYVRGLSELATLVELPDFVLNARTCKFILQASPEDVMVFAEMISQYRAKHILSSMVADGYHKIPAFRPNFDRFSNVVAKRLVAAVHNDKNPEYAIPGRKPIRSQKQARIVIQSTQQSSAISAC